MEKSQMVERLAAHRTLASVPRDELAWLAAVGHQLTLEPGEVLTPSTGPVEGLYIVIDGQLLIRVDRGTGPRIVMEWRPGDVTGLLPYSRIKAPPGNVVAEERTAVLAVDPSDVQRMIHECPALTTVLVHMMLDRARVFRSSELLDEKMASLGRLAAGLAHELNNPASAVARSAKTLVAELPTLEEASRQFFALNLSDADYRAICALRKARTEVATVSLVELADRQDSLSDWFSAQHVPDADVESLAESGFMPDDLEMLNRLVGAGKLSAVLTYLTAGRTVRQLATEIDTAATRIHSLVAAVKGFTYVNQQATLQPIAIGQGLSDTVTVLRSKARSMSVDVEVRVPENLPTVEGYGGELNQVWANLVDNAIDAAPGGRVKIEADAANDKVIVRVIDNGPGIAPDVANHIFDPFFTTKEIGQGTGLGLDIARRIVHRHRGAIDVTTGPGGTEFRVTLPAAEAASGRKST